MVDSAGSPFFLHGDTGWSAVAMLNDVQLDQYVNDRAAKGFTAIMIEAPVFTYTATGSPANVEGVGPFTVMSPNYNWVLNNLYWQRVDRMVNLCRARGIAVILNPAYWGYNGSDGCKAQIDAASTGALQAYGAALAHRYTQGNVIWSMGGDYAFTARDREKQWNIVTGIRSVRTTDVVTAHPASNESDSYAYWGGHPGFTLNTSYTYETDGQYPYSEGAIAYGRPGPMPYIFFEGKYENSSGASTAMLRRQSYGALLSGACGQVYGNLPIWSFGSPLWGEPYPGTWESNLSSLGATEQSYVKALFTAFSWWKLQPRTDTTLVTSGLGSGTTRLYPALASDGSFAMVYVPGSQTVMINKAVLTVNPLRIRLYDPTTGTFSTYTTSTINSGIVSVSPGDERVIVIDAAA